jgi:hypothetical protein
MLLKKQTIVVRVRSRRFLIPLLCVKPLTKNNVRKRNMKRNVPVLHRIAATQALRLSPGGTPKTKRTSNDRSPVKHLPDQNVRVALTCLELVGETSELEFVLRRLLLGLRHVGIQRLHLRLYCSVVRHMSKTIETQRWNERTNERTHLQREELLVQRVVCRCQRRKLPRSDREQQQRATGKARHALLLFIECSLQLFQLSKQFVARKSP